MSAKARILIPTLAAILITDILTKRWALAALGGGERIELFGGLVPLTLAFNKGAAFSIHFGDASRWIFLALSLVALWVLAALYRAAQPGDRLRVWAVSLIMAGALGNLVDRVRWSHGVVDFIGPIDLGFMLWPVFNVADMAITCGGVLLVISLWQEGREAKGTARSPSTAPEGQ
ncbi:MAG: signal peptidase II [bacterium]|jgi:signal peptidase II|nr:MAG: signal peptidase II [bacterium]